MKPPSQGRITGFTLVEVLVVIVCLAMLAGAVLPYLFGLSRPKAKSNRITCVNNLKQIGLGMRVFAADNGGHWPMALPSTNGGTKEYVADSNRIWRHWLAVSNELASPKILICPSDRQRQPASRFSLGTNVPPALVFNGNHQVSYFLGLNAAETEPNSILAGDRNVSTNGIPLAPGRHVLDAGTQLGFTAEMHNLSGNILLGDGSVQQVTSGRLTGQFQDALKSARLTTNVWLIP